MYKKNTTSCMTNHVISLLQLSTEHECHEPFTQGPIYLTITRAQGLPRSKCADTGSQHTYMYRTVKYLIKGAVTKKGPHVM